MFQNLWAFLPKVTGGEKRAQLGSTSDNFKIRSRMSPERIEISQIFDSGPFRVRRKKSGELWSTNNNVGHVSLDRPKSTFSEDHISAP